MLETIVIGISVGLALAVLIGVVIHPPRPKWKGPSD